MGLFWNFTGASEMLVGKRQLSQLLSLLLFSLEGNVQYHIGLTVKGGCQRSLITLYHLLQLDTFFKI